jgi:hypothetical protein
MSSRCASAPPTSTHNAPTPRLSTPGRDAHLMDGRTARGWSWLLGGSDDAIQQIAKCYQILEGYNYSRSHYGDGRERSVLKHWRWICADVRKGNGGSGTRREPLGSTPQKLLGLKIFTGSVSHGDCSGIFSWISGPSISESLGA